MEIKQLEIFACVAKTLSFSKAAEILFLSQPTVSSSIRALEKYLGAQLLIRSTKEVSLTKAGQELLAYSQKILSLREQAISSVGGADSRARGSIDIISSTIPAQHLLPELLASFQERWPNVLFRVEQADSRQVERRMGGFQYDFGMVGTTPGDDRFVHYPVFDDELVLAVPPGTQETAEMIREHFAEYIRRTPVIMRESGSGTRVEIEALLSKLGVDLRDLHVRAYFSDAHSILSAVAHGMGVSLISRIAAAMYVEDGLLRIVEMDSPLFRRQIYLLYNKELWLSPLQQAFIGHIRGFYNGGV